MNKHFFNILFVVLLFIPAFLSCGGQNIEPFEIPVEGKIVYVEGIRGEGYLNANPFGELVLLDGKNQTRQVLTWDGYYYAHPNLTPDGKSMIFESKQSQNIGISGLSVPSNVYMMDLETKMITDLNDELSNRLGLEQIGNDIKNPALSPSGNKMVMVRSIEGVTKLSFYDYQQNKLIDLTTERELLPRGNSVIEWSDNELYIIYEIVRGLNTLTVLFDIANKEPILITDDLMLDRKPRQTLSCVSGGWLSNHEVFFACRYSGLNHYNLYVYDTDSREREILNSEIMNEIDLFVGNPRMDQKRENFIFIGSSKDYNEQDLYRYNIHKGEIKQLTFSKNKRSWFRWYKDLQPI